MKFKEVAGGIYISKTGLCKVEQKGPRNLPSFSSSQRLDFQLSKDDGKEQGMVDGLNPEEFLIRPFRVLSATIINKGPIDYSKPGVLERAVELFKRTLYEDHWTAVRNWCGLLKNPRFNSKTDPPGIDVDFWIDLKSQANYHTARGVEIGALDRCSAGLTFRWSKSHPAMKDRMFYDSLGDQVEGELVRIIVEEIIEVWEVSLVFWGADHTAKAIKQNKDNKEVEDMDEQKIKLKLSGVPDTDIVNASGKNLELGIETLADKFTQVKQERDDLAKNNLELEKFQCNRTEELKERCLTDAKLIGSGTLRERDRLTIEQTTDYDSLVKLAKEFETEKKEKFPSTCQSCGTKVDLARSSVELEPNNTSDEPEEYPRAM